MKYLRWLGRVVPPYGFPLTFIMLCHVAVAACSIGFVYSSKRLVDCAVEAFNSVGTSENSLWHVNLRISLVCLLGVVLLRIVLNALRTYVQTKTEIRFKNDLRRRLFDILLRLQSDGGRKHHSGDILNRIQEDVRVVSSAIAVSLPNLIGTALQFAAALAFLLYLDMHLAMAVVAVVPVGLMVGKFITGRIRSLTLDIRKNDSKVQEHLQESIQHLTLLQSLEYAQTSSAELGGLQGNLYTSELRRSRFSVVSRIFISLAFQAGYVIAFMWGVLGISYGTVTYGMMTAFLQLVGQIQRPLLEMSNQIPSIIHSTASVDRILEIESLPQEDDVAPVLLEGPAGIRLENITFAYPDSDRKIFGGFSFDFTPGSRTAIVGPTGIGKSTLIRLLLSLLKPVSGHIHVYSGDCMVCSAPQASGAYTYALAPQTTGQNLRDSSVECDRYSVPVSSATRCNLVYVPQGNSLFSGTIRDNLLMGNPEATEEQMREALHIAVADFVLDLTDGLDSHCSEGGVGLSEGQAQRIAIARALLRPGSILLLDEFSSALDAETETLLMERLTSSLPDHTMIFITHRDKIIDYCTSTLRLG